MYLIPTDEILSTIHKKSHNFFYELLSKPKKKKKVTTQIKSQYKKFSRRIEYEKF